MLCEYSHTKSESWAQIYTIMAETAFFLGDCFLLAHPVERHAHQSSQHSLQVIRISNVFTGGVPLFDIVAYNDTILCVKQSLLYTISIDVLDVNASRNQNPISHACGVHEKGLQLLQNGMEV